MVQLRKQKCEINGEIKSKIMKEKGIREILESIEILKERKRSGWQIRGLPTESISDHITGTTLISLLLANLLDVEVDIEKTLKFSLLHDFPEAKLSDLDKLSKKYIDKQLSERKAIEDISEPLKSILKEYKKSNSLEKKIVKDADKLDMNNRLNKLKEIGYSGKKLKEFQKDINFNFDKSNQLFDLIKSD
ncbi:hypothetical protein C9439_04265 [archaeon SCG-AAA382B04]|nr:hypothetical protein C9439_04265 [archaeon SCG-AAA382B04]